MWRSAWRWTFVALIVLGSLSNAVALPQSIWWDNHDDATSEPMASALNASSTPPLLLIRPDNLPRLLVLSRYLRDDARFEIVAHRLPATRIENAASLYVLNPDAYVRRLVARTTDCPLRPLALETGRATPADNLHASLSHYRGATVDALWTPAGGTCR